MTPKTESGKDMLFSKCILMPALVIKYSKSEVTSLLQNTREFNFRPNFAGILTKVSSSFSDTLYNIPY